MRHENIAALPRAMIATLRAGSPHWSVRRLEAFTAPEAFAFARLLKEHQANAEDILRGCEENLQRLQRSGKDVLPLPMLVMDEDAEPAILLPLACLRRPDGLFEVTPMPLDAPGEAGENEGGSRRYATPLCRPHLNLTRQEANAILRALFEKMPAADIARFALCAPANLDQPMHLPPAHALSWRGMYHLLRQRLAVNEKTS